MKFLLLLSLCAVIFAQEHSFLEDGDSLDIEEADEDVMHRQLPMDLKMRAKKIEKMTAKRLKDKDKMSKKREMDKKKMSKKREKDKKKMDKKREMDKKNMAMTAEPVKTKKTMMPKMTKMPKKTRVPKGLDPEIYGKDGCVKGKVRVDILQKDVTVENDANITITAQAKWKKTKNPTADKDKGGIFLAENTISATGVCTTEVKLVFRSKKGGTIIATGPCNSETLDAEGTNGVYLGATGFAVFKSNKNVIHVNAKICQPI